MPIEILDSTQNFPVSGYPNGTVFYVLGGQSPLDGGARFFSYKSDSTLVADGYFVINGPPVIGGPAGRYIAHDRTFLDLEYAGLVANQDITTFLTTAAGNFVGDSITIRLPRTISNLVSDLITWPSEPSGLKRFVILAGACTISQKSVTTHMTMWDVPNPQNVYVQAGVRFVGNISQPNWNNANPETRADNALLKITVDNDLAPGGTIVNHGNFSSATANGFIVGSSLQPYDRIEIVGDYNSAGIICNTHCDSVTINANLSDADGYEAEHNKTRSCQVGQVRQTLDIDVRQRHGGDVFLFNMRGADISLKIVGSRMGYRSNGTLIDTSINLLTKVDTLRGFPPTGNGTYKADLTYIDCAPNFNVIAAESSPGPTVDCRFLINHPDGSARLAELEDDGADNYECYGNELIPGSICNDAKTGPACMIPEAQLNRLFVSRHANLKPVSVPPVAPDVFVESVAVRVIDTSVERDLWFGRGCQIDLKRCNLPKDILWPADPADWQPTLAPYVINFEDCNFPPETALTPTVLTDLRLGFVGENPGLGLENIPVQSLPYLRIDAAGHPKFLHVDFPQASRMFETINRPVGWKSKGKAEAEWYSGSASEQRSIKYRLQAINRTTCVGGLSFPLLSASNESGTFLWNLGVQNATIRAAITFKQGGASIAGVCGRAMNNALMYYAALDVKADQVRLYNTGTGSQQASAGIALMDNVEYVLEMSISLSKLTVKVDDVEKLTISPPPPIGYVGNTRWGVKHLNVTLDGADETVGPLYRFIEVLPNVGDTSVEAERRGL